MKNVILIALAIVVVVGTTKSVPAEENQQLLARYSLTHLTIPALFNSKSVQDDLKLSKEIAKKSQELEKKYLEILREIRNLPREQRVGKAREATKATEKALAELFTAKQAKRLVQISLQLRGGMALSIEEVAKELRLTNEQSEKVKAIRTEARRVQSEALSAYREAHPRPLDVEGRKKDMEESAAILVKLNKEKSEKLLNLLTDEQEAKWKEMIGSPFKGEVFPFNTPISPKRDDP